MCLTIDIMALLTFRLLRRKRWERQALATMTVVWALATIYLTLFRVERGLGMRGLKLFWPMPILEAIVARHYGLTANRSILNILLFVPLGYMVPRLLLLAQRDVANARTLPKVSIYLPLACGLAVSLAIEVAQYAFGRGVFELDDLVKNTLGTLLGYCAFQLGSSSPDYNDGGFRC